MIKKIVSVVLAAFMLIIPLSAVSLAKEPVTLSLSSGEVYAGDEFTLNLFISDNSKVSGAAIDIKYDNKMLSFVSSENGGILGDDAIVSVNSLDGTVRFTYLDPVSSITSAGVLVKLKFKALDDAVGETSVKIYIADDSDFVTSDAAPIPYKTVDASFKIINTSYEQTDETTETETPTPANDETFSSPTETNTKADENNNDSSDEGSNALVTGVATAGVIVIGVAVALIVYGNIKNKKRAEK